MAKGTIEDIVIKKGKSPIDEEKPSIEERSQEFFGGGTPRKRPPLVNRKRGGSKKKWLVVGGIAVLLLVLFFAFSLSKKVVVAVTPKVERITVSQEITTSLDARENSILFRSDTLSEERNIVIPQTGVREVDKRAQGEITVFNAYSTSPQRLIARTRFETPDGKIFRVADPIVIPGAQDAGEELVPGSLAITVFADEPGEAFNTEGDVTFSIPGLAGTPLFSGMYARSVGPLSGGFSGLVKVVDENEKDRVRDTLRKEVENALREKITALIGEDEILYPDAIFLSFAEVLDDDAEQREDEGVLFTVTGTAHLFIFNRADLSSLLSELYAEEISGSVSVANLDSLIFRIVDKELFDVRNVDTFAFDISGAADFVWDIPVSVVAEALLGTPKDELLYKEIFREQFPEIQEAHVVTFRPFWAQSFPSDPEKIIIELTKN